MMVWTVSVGGALLTDTEAAWHQGKPHVHTDRRNFQVDDNEMFVFGFCPLLFSFFFLKN